MRSIFEIQMRIPLIKVVIEMDWALIGLDHPWIIIISIRSIWGSLSPVNKFTDPPLKFKFRYPWLSSIRNGLSIDWLGSPMNHHYPSSESSFTLLPKIKIMFQAPKIYIPSNMLFKFQNHSVGFLFQKWSSNENVHFSHFKMHPIKVIK